MKDTCKKFASIIFDILEEKGIRDIVCSPGSRNVPLLLAASSREKLNKHLIIDERSAAFYALGMCMVGRKPVVLICTSGTALLNYAPAIAESYYHSQPLIVISADRPIQWIDQDDSQTIRQENALENFVKKNYNIPAIGENNPEMLWYVNRIANDAVITATTGRKGPVHINIPFSEPLGLKVERSYSFPRLINTLEADTLGNKEIIKELANEIAKSKVLLISGFNSPDSELQKVITEFSKFSNVTIMCETISNLHLKANDHSIDSVLTAFNEDVMDELSPDIVISIGGALVSRKLKEYLRRNTSKYKHWSIGFNHTSSDPFFSLSLRIEVLTNKFFKALNSSLKRINLEKKVVQYQAIWSQKRQEALKLKNGFIKLCEWSEIKAFDYILKNLPTSCNLFLSNGTPIRYAQLINYKLPHASFCNRGVSGIDGTLSTAIGGAKMYKGLTILITGDLSFSYDINALGIKDIPANFKIIVIDNQGGGIFRFISATSELEEREEYLCQAPLLPLKELATGYKWEYFECNNLTSLKSSWSQFILNGNKSILKISCPGKLSATLLTEYMNLKI